MSSASDRERMREFFSGYFHEDWELEADVPIGIIDLYIQQHADDEQPLRLAVDLDALTTSDLSDDSLSAMLFEEFGCYYDPASDGLSARTWLRQVSRRLKGNADG